ncbi:MAG: ABC transporter ATP-binding protein [Lachnospiraceae bacterium]|nr:ABC transporter ATP-binding protein [Lachnospiraceae bacterium]
MDFTNVIEAKNIKKSFKNFTLDVPSFKLPKGFATALIGENGAGKTTLLNILTGIRLDYTGSINYFGKYSEKDIDKDPSVKEKIGYTGTENFFLPHWTVGQVEEISTLLFENFDSKKFRDRCKELAIFGPGSFDKSKRVSALSDGTKTKLMLAGVLARETDLLIMDEPASPLDPLMRDKLCELIRDYLSSGDNKSVFFSTHNISDMENVTDYAIIMEQGRIVEQGFVEDLKEKYIAVKGEAADTEKARKILYTISSSNYGFEGICLAEDLDKLAGMDITTETASLFKISVAIMKKNSLIQ